MSYCGYITTLKNVRAHANADRLQLADCFGNTVVIGLDMYEGQKVLYLPTDGQVSVEFGTQNNLLRLKDAEGNNIGGYLDPDKRHIRAMSLRGEKSDGLASPISCLNYCFEDGNADAHLELGDQITIVNGHEICQKYIPKTNHRNDTCARGSKARKSKANIAPLFTEHIDTEQLAYNLSAFRPGDIIEISLKMHGTSQRTGHLPVFKGYKRTLWDKIMRREGKPIYEYDYVTGTRRVVLDSYDGGFYGSNEFREQHAKVFEGKLPKNYTVYYEVVGYTHTCAPIMGECNNAKVSKDFVKQYGKTTTFSYGCEVGGSDIYVYRITVTNDSGHVVDLMPWEIQYYCDLWNVKKVPTFFIDKIPEDLTYYQFKNGAELVEKTETAGDWVMHKVEEFYGGPDPVGKTHVREGVVVRKLNATGFKAYKYKNHDFKVLSGIAVENVNADEVSEDILSEM